MSFLTHSTWVLIDGALHCCGYNEDGQMGIGTFGGTSDVYNFTKFEIPNEKVVSLGCGYQHTVVVTASGKMYGFGNNEKGQLGTVRSGLPVKSNPNPTPVASNLQWSSVSCGAEHTLAITRDGKVFSFGSNEHGQLGLGSSMQSAYAPVQIPFFAGMRATKVNCGYDHSLVWTNDGQLYSFGKNELSQCGQQTLDPIINTPQKIGFGFPVTLVTPGNTHTFALDERNQVWGVGYLTKDLDFGQAPSLVHSFNEKVVSLQTGAFHVNVLTASNKLYSLGQNGYRQVGVNQNGTIKSFQQINIPLNGSYIQSIATGYHHSVALLGNGQLVVWGAQSHGQLGLGTKGNFFLPSVVNSNQRFSNLFLSTSLGIQSIEEQEEFVEMISLGNNRDKDSIIRELQSKNAQQAQRILVLEAEIQSLRIQSSQSQSKTPQMGLGDGAMKISFTK
jgi:alpha-tubulin suppressor-like RCC1 family protein